LEDALAEVRFPGIKKAEEWKTVDMDLWANGCYLMFWTELCPPNFIY
jgi:hypothetical protein